jgi:hypothetical protein
MKLPDLFVNAVTTFDGKALAKGQRQIGGFEKSVKSLGKAFGVTFGAAALAQFGKKSVKAFAEDEAAATRLTKAVENLGLGFEATRISRFIQDLEKSAAVADDVLRPAFQSLLSTTGSVTKSQDLLNLALEISAGTGIDAAEVAKDLSLAYLGQTRGIAKYNTGLSKTELTAAGFLTIQEKLTAQYSGQNAARLDTYAGKVSAVQIAYGNLQETVGGALIDAFMKLAGDTTTEDLTESVDNLADSLAAVVELTGQVAAPFVGLAKLFNSASDAYVKLLYKATGTAFMGNVANRQYGGAAADKYKATEEAANAKARAKAEADAAKRQKELLALQKKSALAEKNKLSLSKAAAVFDSNRISIAAALQATYDKETRLRLEALMAIEDEQGDLALKKINELAALQQNADLARLAGITTISDAALTALNTQLLAELKVINDSKMAESEKERLRDIAFGKYNAALIAAGGLADKISYNERNQIQLTEIAKLAALSNTTNAGLVLNKIRESAELDTIDTIAKAQKAADDARYAALQKYIELLKTLGGGGGGPAPLVPTKKPKVDLLADIKGDYIKPIDTKGGSIDAILEYADAAKARADAFTILLDDQNKADELALNDYLKKLGLAPAPTVNTFGSTPTPTAADIQSGNRYAAQAAAYYVTVNAGVVGSEETLVKAVQDAILTIDRRGDSTVTAGSL